MWKEFLNDAAGNWLPDKVTRWILAATPVTAGLGWKLPELLQTLQVPMHQSSILPYRCTGLLALLCFGLFLAILRVVFYNHSQKLLHDKTTESSESETQPPAHDAASLNDAQKRLLAELASGQKRIVDIRTTLNISSETLKYHLDAMPRLIELCNWDENLRLTQRGRKVAVELDLIDAG
jgi:hypothetical protein